MVFERGWKAEDHRTMYCILYLVTMNFLDATAFAASTFAALPLKQLPASTWVDFLHLVALGKPAVRVRVSEPGRQDLARWCTIYRYAWSSDTDGFFCVAHSQNLADHILEVDRRTEPHELNLGLLLGYPSCCCEAVAELGESKIDDYAMAVASWGFQRQFRLINPSGYTQGASLICHLPCSPCCEDSLKIAMRAARFLRERLEHPAFASWLRWEPLF